MPKVNPERVLNMAVLETWGSGESRNTHKRGAIRKGRVIPYYTLRRASFAGWRGGNPKSGRFMHSRLNHKTYHVAAAAAAVVLRLGL